MPEDTPNPLDDLFPEETTEGEQPKPAVEDKPVKAPVSPLWNR